MKIRKNKKILLIIFIIIIGVFAIKLISLALSEISNRTNAPFIEKGHYESACAASGGTWISEYQECESADEMLSETECTSLGGKYFDCESPCRHEPDTDLCLSICIKVCKF